LKFRLVLALILLAFMSSACSDAQVEVSTRYYDIRGDQTNELRQQMNRKGPRGYDAYAAWYVRWRFDHARSANSCSIADVSASVKVEITLPRWVDEEDADDALRERWQSYYAALVEHENGHRDFGIRAAREIEEALAGLEPQPSCEGLTRIANRTGKSILAGIVAEEKAYDRDTNHGMNDGAVFP
jgi:predicted secreted Zn-dependent protease